MELHHRKYDEKNVTGNSKCFFFLFLSYELQNQLHGSFLSQPGIAFEEKWEMFESFTYRFRYFNGENNVFIYGSLILCLFVRTPTWQGSSSDRIFTFLF